MVVTTEMLPTLIMVVMYVLAACGLYFFINNAGKMRVPFDLVIGFFTVSLLFVLTFQWYGGWGAVEGGSFFYITNYYMAGFTGLVAVIMGAVYVYYLYQFMFEESREVTV